MVTPKDSVVRCLVVSENATHRLTLEHYVNLTAHLQLVASLSDGMEAYDYLHQGGEADLVIMDLNAAGVQADELRPATQPGRPRWLLIEQMGSLPVFTCQSQLPRPEQPLCFSRFGKLVAQALEHTQPVG